MMLKQKINILDCTLRDGGYYNNWDFSLDLVRDYIKSISLSGIKYIELGFRSFSSKSFKGSNWYTTENYINSLSIPKDINICIMINASQIIMQNNLESAVKKIFVKKNKSKVHLVRVASHFHELDKTFKIIKIIKKLGYKVALNLMQISELSEKDLVNISHNIQKNKPDIFYFADSLGSLDPIKIRKIIKNIKTYWKGEIGFHAHDNLGKAILNTKEAINLGVKWVDSTVTGMGRGPGNVQTEYFLLEINNDFKKNYKILPILKLIKKHFDKLKNKYKWGTNSHYYLAGMYGIHPTYIQEMIATHFGDAEILAAIDQLKDSGGSKYNVDLVRSEFQKNIKLKNGTWNPKKHIFKKEVLLIASGKKAKDYKNEIEKYIIEKKPYVIAVNTNVDINYKLIDIYAACNPLKLIANSDNYKVLKSPLAVPASLLNSNLKKKLKNLKLLDFGVGLKQNVFEFKKNGAIMPRLYTLVYALSIATCGGSSKVLLAGFDGYGAKDRRTKIVNELLYLYSSFKDAKSIKAVTPSSYSIASSSIYALQN